MANLLEEASILITPTAYSDGKIHAIKPSNAPFADLDYVRGSIATRDHEQGDNVESQGVNVPRLNFTDGVGAFLFEQQKTNLWQSSLQTQDVTVTAVSYTASFYGLGTITFSGAHTGTLVGTGEGERVSVTFTPSAGTLTRNDGATTILKEQLEVGILTSYIPNINTGAGVTRLADRATKTGLSNYINSEEGTFFLNIAASANEGIFRGLSFTRTTSNGHIFFFSSVSNTIIYICKEQGADRVTISYQIDNTLNFNKIAIKYKSNDFALWVNGVEVGTGQTTFLPTGLDRIGLDTGSGGSLMRCKLKNIGVYKRALSDDELTCLTS